MNKKVIYAALMFVLTMSSGNASAQQLPYQNPALSAHERAVDLCGRLTLEEKASLMLDDSPAIPRLGIKRFQWWSEALHGVANMGDVTVFPEPIGMAASFNDRMVYRVFDATSDEMRAKWNELQQKGGDVTRFHALSVWTPNVNIFRDPRWGRGQETYGEDPYLTSRMGCAVVRGLQGPEDTKYRKLWACAKHYAIHSGPEWARHTDNITDVTPRDLWETYMPAFKSLVQDAKVREVMCAYQRIDGAPCCSNAKFERQILREEWGFKGLITSDCGAVNDFYMPGYHGTAKTATEATAQAVNAGTDLECGSAYRTIPQAVKAGIINEDKVNQSLKRLLVARFKLGDFDKDETVSWTQIPENVIACKAHKDLAEKIAEEGIVLLQNRNQLLPLNRNQKIVVMGPNANDSIMLRGNYSGYPTSSTTILQGIRNYMKGTEVRYVPACTLTRNEVQESRFNLFREGMKATYWNNQNQKGEPVATDVMKTAINLSNGGNTVFAPGVNLTHFSARYEGVLTPDRDEDLTINMGIDDGCRLIVDGDTIVNMRECWGRVAPIIKPLSLKAGKPVKIQIDYTQREDVAVMQFDILKTSKPTCEQILAEVGEADAVVFVGGISPNLEGEQLEIEEPGFKGGDRTDLELPKAQRQVIAMLHQAGKRVVFVNCSGCAIAMVPETENAEAILQAWYPGERGGEAVAKVLFGEVNPSGKLPVTFYKSVNDLPDFLDYTMKNRTYRYFKGEPLFPFGYGLSYTTFEYSKPTLMQVKSKKRGSKAADYKLMFSLQNTGKREGTEVAQVYIKRVDDVDGPIKSLKAFKRVSLKAGERQMVSIDLPRKSFEGWDAQTNTIRVVPGTYQVFVGGSSADASKTKIEVKIK